MLRAECFFPTCSQKRIRGLLVRGCSHASIVLWPQPHPARYELEEADGLGMAPFYWGEEFRAGERHESERCQLGHGSLDLFFASS